MGEREKMITGLDMLIGLGVLVVIAAIGSVYLVRHPEKLDPNNPVNKEYYNNHKNDFDDYNPATGLPMEGAIDTGGHRYGCDD